jgi:hypothetical protein
MSTGRLSRSIRPARSSTRNAGQGQANFRHNANASGFVATHATVSVARSKEEILRLAEREGRAVVLSRGAFNVIEFWVEDHVMLELMRKEMTEDYLRATRFRG